MAEESLEPLITQCPTCRTRFRVSEAQLEVAAGRVRCGACLSVFTGHDHLVLGSGARLRPGENANEALDALLEELRVEPALAQADAGVAKNRQAARGDALESAATDRASADVLADPIEATAPDAEVIAQSVAFDPTEDVVSQADTSRSSAQSELTARRARLRAARAGDAPMTRVAAAVALELDPEELIQRPLRRRRRWWVPFAVLVGVTLLVGQVLYFQFDAWAKNPQFRPVYQWLCQRLECELPVMRSLAAIYSKNLVVRSHPDVPGMLLVDAVVVNQAPYPQPFPVIELRFSSLSGSPVAARRFRPDEYLAGELAGATTMASLTPIHIAFQISDPGNAAVNYVLVFR